jgi:membrane carboxypeptidase/penicillin-binding protein PbpC
MEQERILDPRVAYLITDVLSDEEARIPSFGEGSALKLTRPAAVKTGTTTDFRDNWTVGYTPELVVGVWTGNADNEAMRDVSGISGAAPIWHDFMETALKGQPVSDFQQPERLLEVEVCALSGLLPSEACPHRVTELFIEGTEPTLTCSMHQRIAIDRATGLQATADTPAEQVVERVYTILPPEVQAWAREQGIPEPPPSAEWALDDGEWTAALMSGDGEHPLVMSSPDTGAIYQLDRGLPRDAQQIVVSARPGSAATLVEVTLLVDGQPMAQSSAPPYQALWRLEPGVHVFSAEGRTPSGEQVMSEEVWVEVRE